MTQDSQELHRMAAQLGASLFESKKRVDVIFVAEGEAIPAHRVVLSVCCQYFDTMLFGATNEAKKDRIELNETPAKQFKQIVRYCYLRSLEVNDWDEHELLKLLSLAHEYQFEELMNLVELELREKHVKADTIDVIFTYSARLERANLIQNCLTFAEQHVEEVLQDDHFLSYSAALLSSMLERESFANYNQDQILRKIGKWKVCRSSDEFKWILKKVTWSSISQGTLVKLIQEFVDKTDCTQLHFWDSFATQPAKGSIVQQQTMLNQCSSHRSLPTLFQICEESEEENTGQLASVSASVDRTQDLGPLTGKLKDLFFAKKLKLQNNVEHNFANEIGAFDVCLVDDGVRVKFRDRNVSLGEVSFDVGCHIFREIGNMLCNGAEYEIHKAPREGWVNVRFEPSNDVIIPAGQWFQVLLSRRLHYLNINDLAVRGQFI